MCRDKSELLQTTTPKKKNNFVEVNLIYVQKKKKKTVNFVEIKLNFVKWDTHIYIWAQKMRE